MSPKLLDAPPDRTAVLFIECQNGIIGPESPLKALASDVAPVLPALGRLARGARDAGVLVAHLTFVPLADNRSANRHSVLFAGILDAMDEWTPDHPATKVVDEIGVGPTDLVLARNSGLSPTFSTDTFKILRNIGIKTVVVAGVSTNIAIPVVITQAVDEGFDVIVPRDAVIGSPPDYAEAMMKHTIGLIAHVTSTAALLDGWGSVS
jgi:nicotinamidase-related amidase